MRKWPLLWFLTFHNGLLNKWRELKISYARTQPQDFTVANVLFEVFKLYEIRRWFEKIVEKWKKKFPTYCPIRFIHFIQWCCCLNKLSFPEAIFSYCGTGSNRITPNLKSTGTNWNPNSINFVTKTAEDWNNSLGLFWCRLLVGKPLFELLLNLT